MNRIVALLSDERLGCRARKERIVRYVMTQRIPDQVSWIYRLTGNNDTVCLDNLRMDMGTFARLCYLLHNVGGLSDSKHVRVEEKVCFFLTVLAHHKKNRIVKFDHVRSGHTVSIYFNTVLISLLKLHPIILVTPKLVDDECTVARWKQFKTLRQYYLCDNSYMNCPRFLAPYRSVRYHLDEWCEGSRALQNVKELYNQRHTKARNVIERTWSIMKWRWAVLRSTRFYALRTQNGMILSCALLHNFIRCEMEVDSAEAQVPNLDPNHQNLYADDEPAEDEFVESVGPNYEWSAWRDNLANGR
ncbi:hypothetical protein BUALT_Bualt11G0020900 [Buddleja alternifolia]|uniref:DDE Tnp4 domain-containing protein n=1 Tax=Buddleja alternifolia TaxID=168488 RepID=A0AAV6X2I7_9LAMI|nr:hypothetical protein BUALT_Bualt11G0020900 [Buddleja alternifolia]